MNAIEDNTWSRGMRSLGALLPRPRAVLSVSAHWFVSGSFLTAGEHPATIHDFGGFPRELYEMEYPAPGDPDLAARVVRLLGEARASLRSDWGLDHGTWTVLHHLLPKADCPVVQLSIDMRMPPGRHFETGKALAPLRDDGVLILGSGNITHNLGYAISMAARGDLSTPAWASRFDEEVRRIVEDGELSDLAGTIESPDGRRCHPTLDHYLPLLYAAGAAGGTVAGGTVAGGAAAGTAGGAAGMANGGAATGTTAAGASGKGARASFPIEGFDMGSLSMRAILFG